MVAAFPLAKLGALLLKQISKPLANVVKARAKKSVFFRTYVCMPPAQFYHWCEVKMKMWSMNLGAAVKIPKLNENMAIDLGAELVGEGIVFTIAATVLILEYIRSSRKEAVKEEERLEELIRIQAELKDLYFSKAKHEAQIRELVRVLHISLPAVDFQLPSRINEHGIPEHHRTDFIGPPESSGVWGSMKGLVWSAIDVLLPPVEDTSSSNTQQQQQTPPAPPLQPPKSPAAQEQANKAVDDYKNSAKQSHHSSTTKDSPTPPKEEVKKS